MVFLKKIIERFRRGGISACLLTGLLSSPTFAAERIIAVGDLHGDYDAYQEILSRAGLIDVDGNWAGGATVFVQTGDIVDRGPDSLKIITHIRRLTAQAKAVGGEVIVLLGNHEAMVRVGDLRYVHPGEYAIYVDKGSEKLRREYFRANRRRIRSRYRSLNPMIRSRDVWRQWKANTPLGFAEMRAAWSDQGDLGKWVLNRPTAVKVGDSLFVHGGLSPGYAELSLDAINKAVTLALKRSETAEESILFDEDGPLWYRAYILRPQIQNFAAIDEEEASLPREEAPWTPREDLISVLKLQKVTRMIVGHTPSRRGIRSRYGGRLIQIDTGASAYYKGTRSFLRIEDGKIFAHDGDRIRELPGGGS